jgi:hypothetical protein
MQIEFIAIYELMHVHSIEKCIKVGSIFYLLVSPATRALQSDSAATGFCSIGWNP